MKMFALSILIAVASIQSAEWFFQNLEIRPSHYVAITGYIQQDPQDKLFIDLVYVSLRDGKITSREYKPIVDYVMEKHHVYEQKIDVPETVDQARTNLAQLLFETRGSNREYST